MSSLFPDVVADATTVADATSVAKPAKPATRAYRAAISINIVTPDDLVVYDAVRAIAQRECVPVGDIVREALYDIVEEASTGVPAVWKTQERRVR